MYVNRYLVPLSQYAEEKFTYKKAWLFYLTGNIRQAIAVKSRKEILAIQPDIFVAEKDTCCMYFRRDFLPHEAAMVSRIEVLFLLNINL